MGSAWPQMSKQQKAIKKKDASFTFPSNPHCSNPTILSLFQPLSQALRLETRSWKGHVSAFLEIFFHCVLSFPFSWPSRVAQAEALVLSLFSLNSCTVGCPQSASQLPRSNFVQLPEVLRVRTLFPHLVWDFSFPTSSQLRSVLVP